MPAGFPDFTEKADIVELSSKSVIRQLVGNICFIVPDVTDLTVEETTFKTEIEKKYNLYMFSSVDSGNIDFSNFNVVILSTDLTLTDLDELIYLEKPIITMDPSHPNGLLAMTTNAGTSSSVESQVDIQTIQQQIISGADIKATGYKTVYSGGDTLTGVTLAGVSGIINLAVKVGTAYSALCVLEKGADNASGDPNPDIRIFFGMSSGDKLDATGFDLLLQSILYSGCMASNVSHSTYQLLKKLQTIEYKVSSMSNFPLGNMYFVKTTGSDTSDGTSWAKARLTINKGVELTTPNNNDYIFVAPGIYDENANTSGAIVDQTGIHLVGAGNFDALGSSTKVVNSNAAAGSVFQIENSNIELTGFIINETSNTVEGVILTSSGHGAYVHHNRFTGAMENAIRIEGVSNCIIEYNEIDGISDDGIEITGTSNYNRVRYNDITAAGDTGINLNGDDVDNNYVYTNTINGVGLTEVGIGISLGDYNIVTDNTIGGCNTAPIIDMGTGNIVVGNHVDKLDGTFNLLVADGTNLTTKVTNIDLPSSGRFVVQFDVDPFDTNEAGKEVSIYVYVKIDSTNYQIADYRIFLAGTDITHPRVEFDSEGGVDKVKIATQLDAAVTATRLVNYKITQITS